jgi:hypothetical protein
LGSRGLDAQGLIVGGIGNHGKPRRMRCQARLVSRRGRWWRGNGDQMKSEAKLDGRMMTKKGKSNSDGW